MARTRFRVPSVSSLRRICKERAATMRVLLLQPLNRNLLWDFVHDNPWVELPQTKAWLHQCGSIPSAVEIVLEAANEILDGCGVEAIPANHQRFFETPTLRYVNLGDTYTDTLCRFGSRWQVCSWGDIVERNEKLFGE